MFHWCKFIVKYYSIREGCIYRYTYERKVEEEEKIFMLEWDSYTSPRLLNTVECQKIERTNIYFELFEGKREHENQKEMGLKHW